MPNHRALNADQRATLAGLWQEARCDPRREADMLAWCERQYVDGTTKPKPVDKPGADALTNAMEWFDQMGPWAFHILVDALIHPKTKAEQRQARAVLKRIFKTLSFVS